MLDHNSSADMFRPPVDRAMRFLHRPFFNKKIPLAAAKIFEKSQISRCRVRLGRDILQLEHINSVRNDPVVGDFKTGLKSLLLQPCIRPDGTNLVVLKIRLQYILICLIDPSTWTSKVKELVDEKKVGIEPYILELNYDDWTYRT